MYLLILISLISLVSVVACVVIASRRHKQIVGELRLIGSEGSIVKALCPEGAVMIEGELWRARSHSGEKIADGKITVIGANGHLLDVELIARKGLVFVAREML